MTQSLDDNRAREREKLEMRVGFAAAVFAVAYAFIALLDRMGAPEGFVGALSPYFTIIKPTSLQGFDYRQLTWM